MFQNRKLWMRQEGEEMLKWLSDLISLDDFIADKLKKEIRRILCLTAVIKISVVKMVDALEHNVKKYIGVLVS
jgi:vacuolar-type H+-ATPase subunit F/Vma7